MGKYIGHRLVARPQPANTFWTDSTLSGPQHAGFKQLAPDQHDTGAPDIHSSPLCTQIPQYRQHILADLGAEEVAVPAPCPEQVAADPVAPAPPPLASKSPLLNVDLRLGRWDSRRLYRLFDHVLVGDRFADLSDNSRVTLATQTSVERMQSVVQVNYIRRYRPAKPLTPVQVNPI